MASTSGAGDASTSRGDDDRPLLSLSPIQGLTPSPALSTHYNCFQRELSRQFRILYPRGPFFRPEFSRFAGQKWRTMERDLKRRFTSNEEGCCLYCDVLRPPSTGDVAVDRELEMVLFKQDCTKKLDFVEMSKFTVAELKRWLKSRGLPSGGSKTDLCLRAMVSTMTAEQIARTLSMSLEAVRSSRDRLGVLRRLELERKEAITAAGGSTNCTSRAVKRKGKIKGGLPIPDLKCQACEHEVNPPLADIHMNACWFEEGQANVFHLEAVDRRGLMRLDLALPLTATFLELVRAMEDTWMDCCGHVSTFCYNPYLPPGRTPDRYRRPGSVTISPWAGEFDSWMEHEYKYNHPLRDACREPGMVIQYNYDMGTTTTVHINYKGQRRLNPRGMADAQLIGHAILMRNVLPRIQCCSCLVNESQYTAPGGLESGAFFCSKACFRTQFSPREDIMYQLVNSPRMGCCGYFACENEEYGRYSDTESDL